MKLVACADTLDAGVRAACGAVFVRVGPSTAELTPGDALRHAADIATCARIALADAARRRP